MYAWKTFTALPRGLSEDVSDRRRLSAATGEGWTIEVPELTQSDHRHLRRCIALARQALESGDEPFGSVLVAADGTLLAEDHNRVVETGDRTRHPEFALARWAAENMAPEERAGATVFTSGEHCPMCSAAHGWVGLGRIVYVHSSEQLTGWLDELGVPAPPVRPIPIQEVAPGVAVQGPIPDLAVEMRDLHRRFHQPVEPTAAWTPPPDGA